MSSVTNMRGATLATTAAVLTATGAETVFDHGIVTFSIDGKQYIKAAVVDGATPVVDVVTGLAFPALVGGASVANTPGHGCILVWCYDSGGTIRLAMGPHASLNMQGSFGWDAPQFPNIPGNLAPFAYTVAKAGATASATTVVVGTANWNATGFTSVHQLVQWLPSRPQVS